VAGVIGVHPWQLALFPDRVQQEMWGEDPTTMHSSSYNPTGRAEKVSGGYRLSGRWSFSSGCDHCRAVVLGGYAGTQSVGGAEIPSSARSSCSRISTGSKTTGTSPVSRPPAARTSSSTMRSFPSTAASPTVDYAENAPLPGRSRTTGRCSPALFGGLQLGDCGVDARLGTRLRFALDRADSRSEAPDRSRPPIDPLVQRRIAEASWSVDGAIARLREDAEELWQMAEARVPVAMAQRGQYRFNMNRGCQAAGEAVHALYQAATGRSIFLDHPLQRRFQDVQGALRHAFLDPDPLARAVGGALLGARKPERVL
jgi:3-hydroxy-9,10-secoandrosta-1,3,5(10)-triene-9,17-dione monooxygenase